MKTAGLNYDTALARAARGKQIKRATWLTWLKEDADQVLHFQMPKGVKADGGTAYTATPTDIAAQDWEVA